MTGVSAVAYLELLESGRYSDFIIDCQGYEFKVHRSVICTASPMLDKACSGSFMEASEGRINLSEDHPAILARVVQYLYTNSYDATRLLACFEGMTPSTQCQNALAVSLSGDVDPSSWADLLKIHALVYKSADMLGIESLKVEASSRFLVIAKSVLGCDAFAEPLKVMFESTMENDRHLRVPVFTLCLGNYATIVKQKPIVEVIMKYEPTVWSYNESVFNLAKSEKSIMEETLAKLRNVHCSNCGANFPFYSSSHKIIIDDALEIKGWCSSLCHTPLRLAPLGLFGNSQLFNA